MQIDQNQCIHCERCLRACRAKAIYFEHGIRLIDYSKCRSCLGCVLVCPKNAIEVTSVVPNQVLTVKIEHDECNMCLKCVNPDETFCPQRLFYIEPTGKEKRIKFKFKDVAKCQGCLKCELSCPKKAIKPIKFDF